MARTVFGEIRYDAEPGEEKYIVRRFINRVWSLDANAERCWTHMDSIMTVDLQDAYDWLRKSITDFATDDSEYGGALMCDIDWYVIEISTQTIVAASDPKKIGNCLAPQNENPMVLVDLMNIDD